MPKRAVTLVRNTHLRAWSQIITGLAGHGDPSWLGLVFELTMAASLGDQEPAILQEEAEDLGDLHSPSIHGLAEDATGRCRETRRAWFCEA
jgi:hypothetical protein